MLPNAEVPAALLNLDPSESIRPDTISKKDLFVGDYFYNVVEIYQNGTFKKIGQIKNGINGPVGTWVDSHGLYVANEYAASITQYSSPKSKPFIYNAGMAYPNKVTSDGYFGDVFEADGAGYVNEYQQRRNVLLTQCSLGGPAVGVANDTGTNVFVAYDASGIGHIAEFTNFSYCEKQKLGVTLKDPHGMAIDSHNNIIVAEGYGKTVDIIKPPYTKISGHLGSGWYLPLDVKINAAQNRAWVADNGSVVDVYYPSGKVVWDSGSIGALSAVDGSNYAP